MTKYKLVDGSKVFEFASLEQAENFALANEMSVSQILEVNIPTQGPDIPNLIDQRIQYFQSVAPKLVRELYVDNTMAGITAAQSDEMFDDFADVLLRIKEGAFPTALYRLDQKQPAGFVTQELINSWKAKIASYMV